MSKMYDVYAAKPTGCQLSCRVGDNNLGKNKINRGVPNGV